MILKFKFFSYIYGILRPHHIYQQYLGWYLENQSGKELDQSDIHIRYKEFF